MMGWREETIVWQRKPIELLYVKPNEVPHVPRAELGVSTERERFPAIQRRLILSPNENKTQRKPYSSIAPCLHGHSTATAFETDVMGIAELLEPNRR